MKGHRFRMTETSETEASQLLWTLLEVSERAARIARECRSERELFSLLVQEKSGDERNSRFVHDFKTLADVLIQETVKHYLTQKVSTELRVEIFVCVTWPASSQIFSLASYFLILFLYISHILPAVPSTEDSHSRRRDQRVH